MIKVAIIGAGSGFGSVLSIDILSRKPLRNATIALCDIHAGRLKRTKEFVEKTIAAHKLPAKVQAAKSRRTALKGADFVVTSISVGGRAYWGEPYASEINIPLKYGVDQRIGDTIGPGGVFRFLRTAPAQMAVCRDMEELCPEALLLNYTNPMAMLTWAHNAGSRIQNAGLCHSVQGTKKQLAGYMGVPNEEVSMTAGGINHQSWILELRRGGKDLYPLLRKKMREKKVYEKDPVRFELMKQFGYFVTESSPHNSEYVPYFRKTAEERAYFGLETKEVQMKGPEVRHWMKDAVGKDGNIKAGKLKRSHEFASGIMEAVVTDVPFRFHGSVMNTGLISNLPQNCCAEVACMADRRGIHPCHLGALPPQLAALNRSNIGVQELAVKAFLEKDREAAFHACALDPLTAAILPLHKIREMFEEMWGAEKHLLTYFGGKA